MIFTDPSFLFVALPLVLLAFYGSAHVSGQTGALGVLFAASLLIYAPFGLGNLGLLLASVAVNFGVASWLLRDDPAPPKLRLTVFLVGQAYNLATLLWFKYVIFQQAYGRLIGLADLPTTLLIPIGISFYTFQQASALADAYQREPAVQAFFGTLGTIRARLGAFVRYGFFVTFFPHMIIGPIAYIREIQPQISASGFGRFRSVNFNVGLMLITFGLFKKLVIADNLALAAEPVFQQASAGANLNSLSAALGIFSYYFQLYFDFSGYSDMALGLARLFGIVFPINFFSPLKAVGIMDYYRRWHMTLTRAISRFLFSPLALAGGRFAARRRTGRLATKVLTFWLPLWLNFVIIGVWHGGLWTFVAFGVAHGTWYILETEVRGTRAWKKWRKRTSAGLRRLLGRAMFVVPMALTLAIFRSDSVTAYVHLLQELVRLDPVAPRAIPTVASAGWIALATVIVYFLPNGIELMRRYRPGIMTYENESYGPRVLWRPTWAWVAIWLGLVMAALYYVWRQPPFLYMGF